MKTFKVYLGACSVYDPARIASIIEKGLDAIGFSRPISGHVVIKPNLVMAHHKIAPDAFTRAEMVEGLVQVVQSKYPDITKLDIVEKSGLGITTSRMFKNADYGRLKKKYGVRLRAMEENAQVRVHLENGKVHKSVNVAKEMMERNFLIFMPKLKSNVLSHGLSAALKLNIGTIDSRERLYHHHYDLPKKIVDLLEIANPDLIVTDGIRMAFGGNQMTQHGQDLGVIVIAENAVAHDMVCARLLNLNLENIEHIQEAVKRGCGPASLDEIEILGDYSIDTALKVTKDLDLGFRHVENVKSPITVHAGEPYCTGGCHGIFLDWIYMIKDRKPKLFNRLPGLTVLVGKVEKEIKAGRIVMIGDCAKRSNLRGKGRKVWIRGCPPSHKRIVWEMLVHFLIFNPLVRPCLIWDAYISCPFKILKGWWLNRNRPDFSFSDMKGRMDEQT